MVGIFVQLIKLSKLNISAQEMTDLLLTRFLSSGHCPLCGAGNLRKYRNYSRWTLEYRNGQIIQSELHTKRFRCGSCHSSHAFLVALIIPYSPYSLLTVLWALSDYFSHRLTVRQICEKYKISAPTLYRWKARFLHAKSLWLGVLKDAVTSEIQFLKDLLNFPDFMNFERGFMKLMPDHHRFLQGHRNARSGQYI